MIVMIGLGMATTARAGFVEGSFDCNFPDDPDENGHTWDFDDATDTLTLGESIAAVGPDAVQMCGETDSDPIFHVTKEVENVSGVTWTGYKLTLDGAGGVEFANTGDGSKTFSDVFSTVTPTGTLVLDFSGGSLPSGTGNTVTLDFEILVPTTGTFEFTLTQNPIPEPTPALLLIAGGVALFMRRRARSTF
jgi:hypothetical protein